MMSDYEFQAAVEREQERMYRAWDAEESAEQERLNREADREAERWTVLWSTGAVMDHLVWIDEVEAVLLDTVLFIRERVDAEAEFYRLASEV
jgi:hypothetical protein